MSENNIVRGIDFKQKKRVTTTEQSPSPEPAKVEAPKVVSDDYKHIGPLSGEALFRAQKDLIFMLKNMDYVRQTTKKLEDAGDTIFSLRDFVPDKESIRIRRDLLKSRTLEELCKEVERTNELQWKSQPSYLGALSLEHHSRVQLALSLMNEEGDEKK